MKMPGRLHERSKKKLSDLPDDGIKQKVNNVIYELEHQIFRNVEKLVPYYQDLYRARVNKGDARILFYVSKKAPKTKYYLL